MWLVCHYRFCISYAFLESNFTSEISSRVDFIAFHVRGPLGQPNCAQRSSVYPVFNNQIHESNICLHCFWCRRLSQYSVRRNVRWAGILVFVCLLLTFMHHLLECLGFTWYLHVVLPMLPIPQHGVFKELPSFVTICTPQCLVHASWIDGSVLKDFLSVHRPRAILSALSVCAPPGGLTQKPWHYCLASELQFPCCVC